MNVIQFTDKRSLPHGDVWARLKPSTGMYHYSINRARTWCPEGYHDAKEALDSGESHMAELAMQEGALSS